jgi:CBS domain-containing protein
MSVGRICTRSVVVAPVDMTVRKAARLMVEHRVGTLVVLDPERRPSGLLTDRDVALRCVAEGRDPDATAVSDVMSSPAICVEESTPIESALSRMAGVSARRLVVTDSYGRLVGILAMDDVLELLAEEMESVGRLLARASASPRE